MSHGSADDQNATPEDSADDEEEDLEQLDDDPTKGVGPAAVLLCAFDREETTDIGALLEHIGATEHRVIHCSTTMGQVPLRRALGGSDGGRMLPVGKAPRVMVLSGMSNQQIQELIDSYGRTGLPRPVFAVTTAVNLDWTVLQLLEDLLAEHEAAAAPSA